MKLLNERNQVRTVARRWHAQYDEYTADECFRTVADRLDALDVETATAGDVAEIIGNALWVEKHTCDECGVKTWDAVQVGQEPTHYGSNTADICVGCLRAALRLLGAAT